MEWISVNTLALPKDNPILISGEILHFPVSVIWLEDGTYGEPGFFMYGYEHMIKEEHISHWMYLPAKPV
jgi:hypothetical protein